MLVSWSLVAALGTGCSASSSDGGSKDGNDGNVDGLDPGTDSLDGVDGLDGVDSGTDGPGSGNYCQEVPLDFVPQTPTVYLLVDRSGSMTSEGFWAPLRTGILSAVEQLQSDVRFGFGSYTGLQNEAACTTNPVDDLGSIAVDNYAAIAAKYNGLTPPTNGQTPTAAAVQVARDLLLADPSPGERFIALVTDGNPDFCNDGEDTCAQDALIGALQEAYESGIKTLVFGLQAKQFPIEEATMGRYANAGAGGGVVWAKGNEVNPGQTTIGYECSGSNAWKALPKQSTGAVGVYSSTAGDAVAATTVDPAELTESMRAKISGLKSCIFDLGNSGVSVKTGATGDIFVDDMETPIPTDQWQLNSATVLELKGDACVTWQKPEVTKFFAGFACDQIVR